MDAKDGSIEIVVLLDRSGSMQSIKRDMEQGFDGFVAQQRKVPGTARVTLTQFDTQGTDLLYEAQPLDKVPALVLEPRGGTPLLDAMGTTINLVTDRLAKAQGAARPDRVLFLVLTDGEENSSRKFTKKQIADLVKERTDDGWEFSFLGANLDSFAEAGSLGIAAAATANFVPDSAGVQHAFAAVACGATAYRSGMGYSVRNLDARVAQTQEPAAVALGRKGGSKGGYARAEALSPEQRSDIASKAAQTRWKRQK